MPVRGFAAAVLSLFVAAPLTAQVRVADPEGRPVAGARVEVWAPAEVENPLSAMRPPFAEGETDASGASPVRLPHRDRLLLLIDHPSFQPFAREMTGAESGPRIVLERGRVWSGRLGQEVPEGRICASWSAELPSWVRPRTWRRCADLTGTGDFTLAGLGGASFDVEVQVPGYLTLRERVDPAAPTPLRLVRGLRTPGRIVGPGTVPLAGAQVRSEGSAPVRSGKDGSFAIAVRALPASLEVSAPGFRSRQVRVEKLPGKKGLQILLERGEQVRGSLVDERGGAVAEAWFWIEREQAGRRRSESRLVRTERGAFLLDLPEPGSYRLRVQAQGFREESLPEVSVSAGEVYALGPVLLRRGAGITGVVVEALSGEPLEGVDVEVEPSGTQLLDAVLHQRVLRAVTDREGRFSVTGLGTGRFGLTARRSDYAPVLAQASLETDRTEDLGPLRMERGVLLRGTVVDREGNPRAAVRVRLFGPEPGTLVPLAERTTARDGTFEGPALASGRYQAQVWGGRLLLAQEIEVPGGREEWPLELVAGGVRLSGVVTRGGEPVQGGSLILRPALDPGESRGKVFLSSPNAGTFSLGLSDTRLSAEVREDGTFEVSDVPTGTLKVDYASGSGTVAREIQVPDSPEASVTLEIGGVELRGRVVDRAQEAGVEALLRVTDEGGAQVASMPTDAEGAFSVRNLTPGRYTVEATAEGFAPRVLTGIVAAPEALPIEIPLDRGGSGSLRVRLRKPDGAPASWVSLALLDEAGRAVRTLPTDGAGEKRFEDLPAGLYVLVWADPYAGTGASEPFRIDGGRETDFQRTLSEGGAVQIRCDLELCAGQPIDSLSLSTPSGAEISPFLSGLSAALRFSATGEVALGRLSPGSYLLKVRTPDRSWSKSLSVGAEEARISLP